jgi:DNA-directed RNA polymerase specialized sigma subunit
LADGSTIPAALATVLSPSIPVSQPLYLSPAKKFAQRYLGRAAKVASSHNPDEELWVTIADVSQACRFLTAQEREVLILRYFYDNVDEDIANALSLSTTQIAELERSGLDRLVRILDNTEDS